MKVSEAIDQLKAGDAVWVKGMVDVVYKGWHPGINIREVGWFCGNTEISLTEPKNEKVGVSQEFADWVEKVMKWKHDGSWAVKEIAGYGWGTFMHDPGTGEELLPKKYLWVQTVQNNKEKHIKAIYDGYTVKPKRWVVKDRKGECVYELRLAYTDTTMVNTNKTGIDGLVFTDKAKAEAVATLVEGSIKEVAD